MVLKNRGCYSIPLFYHLRHNMLCISIIQKHWLYQPQDGHGNHDKPHTHPL